MAGKRKDDIEIGRRVNTAMRLLTEGKTSNAVCQILVEEVGCSESQANRYIRKAKEAITDQWNSVDRREMTACILSKLELVYERSLEHRQYSASQAAIASQAKIVGIDSPRQ